MRSDFVCNRILSLRSFSHKLESLQASYPQYVGSALIMSCCQVWGTYPLTTGNELLKL